MVLFSVDVSRDPFTATAIRSSDTTSEHDDTCPPGRIEHTSDARKPSVDHRLAHPEKFIGPAKANCRRSQTAETSHINVKGCHGVGERREETVAAVVRSEVSHGDAQLETTKEREPGFGRLFLLTRNIVSTKCKCRMLTMERQAKFLKMTRGAG